MMIVRVSIDISSGKIRHITRLFSIRCNIPRSGGRHDGRDRKSFLRLQVLANYFLNM
jgi:hypothetical protein